MATYKVPQDVEAEDKLLGPFTFRQFIYLLIVAGMIGLAYALSKVFPILVILPMPVILLFGALALPLRKDQPMEVYLAALVSFYLKPRKRLWDPDGVESLIEITVPREVEIERTKNLTQADAEQRFSYLANLVDSEGWAVRGQGVQAPSTTSMTTDAYFTAQDAPDVLADDTSVAQSFTQMISKSDTKRHDEAVARMHTPAAATAPAPVSIPVVQATTPAAAPAFNPYPSSMQQTVIEPPSDDAIHQLHQAAVQAANTSEKPVSADIMNLATNTDLSVEAIAHEANRIQQKEEGLQDGMTLSLR